MEELIKILADNANLQTLLSIWILVRQSKMDTRLSVIEALDQKQNNA